MRTKTDSAGAAAAAAHFTTEARRPEAIDAVLAKNLSVARILKGMTQKELAAASGISRATIAQLEAGYSDPRLSTVADLAAALEIPLILLLIGLDDLAALTQAANHDDHATVPAADLERMRQLLLSGMLKDRLRAAKVGAAVAGARADSTLTAQVTAGICSAILPGAGTTLGAALGDILASVYTPARRSCPSED